MWFRNLRLYRLTAPFELSPEALAEQLEGRRARPCGSQERASYGWASPLGRRSDNLVHAAAGRMLLSLRKEERLLPTTVVRDEVARRVEAIEDSEGRSVGRKQRKEMAEEVAFELLPKAFVRSSRTWAYIDPKSGLIVVDASSSKRAEELLSLLRESLGSLPIAPPVLKQSPSSVMTAWLTGDLPIGQFLPQDECELRASEADGAVVRCRKQDLYADEVQQHIASGKRVVKLALQWAERLNFVLDDELAIKRLKFEDIVAEELEHVESDDEAALFDAQFALMSLELANFVPALLEALGGEEESGYEA